MRNLWSKILFPGIITNIPGDGKKIYLTFDDGPTPGITHQVLALLSQYNSKATFFCRGDQVLKNPALFHSIKENGHVIGNHGFAHLNGWLTGNKKYLEDFDKADTILQSSIFRPPYGKISPLQYHHIKQCSTIYLWSALSWDFHPRVSKEWCLKHALNYIKPGSIIVFHDSHKAADKMLYVLPQLLEAGIRNGFEFCSLL